MQIPNIALLDAQIGNVLSINVDQEKTVTDIHEGTTFATKEIELDNSGEYLNVIELKKRYYVCGLR